MFEQSSKSPRSQESSGKFDELLDTQFASHGQRKNLCSQYQSWETEATCVVQQHFTILEVLMPSSCEHDNSVTIKVSPPTISLSNAPSNYPIIFEDSEIPTLNSINILGLQISSSLSWRDHIVQIAKSASKKKKKKKGGGGGGGFSFGVNNILILLNYSYCILVLFVSAWDIALLSGVLPHTLLFSIGLNQRLST